MESNDQSIAGITLESRAIIEDVEKNIETTNRAIELLDIGRLEKSSSRIREALRLRQIHRLVLIEGGSSRRLQEGFHQAEEPNEYRREFENLIIPDEGSHRAEIDKKADDVENRSENNVVERKDSLEEPPLKTVVTLSPDALIELNRTVAEGGNKIIDERSQSMDRTGKEIESRSQTLIPDATLPVGTDDVNVLDVNLVQGGKSQNVKQRPALGQGVSVRSLSPDRPLNSKDAPSEIPPSEKSEPTSGPGRVLIEKMIPSSTKSFQSTQSESFGQQSVDIDAVGEDGARLKMVKQSTGVFNNPVTNALRDNPLTNVMGGAMRGSVRNLKSALKGSPLSMPGGTTMTRVDKKGNAIGAIKRDTTNSTTNDDTNDTTNSPGKHYSITFADEAPAEPGKENCLVEVIEIPSNRNHKPGPCDLCLCCFYSSKKDPSDNQNDPDKMVIP